MTAGSEHEPPSVETVLLTVFVTAFLKVLPKGKREEAFRLIEADLDVLEAHSKVIRLRPTLGDDATAEVSHRAALAWKSISAVVEADLGLKRRGKAKAHG